MSGSRRASALPLLLSVLLCAATVAAPRPARAQDVIEGRLNLLASYGLLVYFYQHEEANPYDPRFGHGVFLRLGGERCGAVCAGLSVLASIAVDPSDTGSVSVGPHIGYDSEGPSWGGPLTFRAGAVYTWLHEGEADFDQSPVEYGEPRGEHGVGAWIELTLELLRRPSAASPVLGLAAGYTAALTTDPVAHILGVRATLGLSVARRLTFGETAEEEAAEEDLDEEDEDELDEDEERRLRQAEDALRRW